MALVTRITAPSMDAVTGSFAPQLSGLTCGEDIDCAAPCYINTDGLVYMADGTAANVKTLSYLGFATRSAKNGQPITLVGVGARFSYGSGLTTGASYWIATTKGRLDTALTTGDWLPVARAVTATDIMVVSMVCPAASP